MTTNKNRIAQLEKQSGTGKKKKYFCVMGLEFLESPEVQAKGYKVQPCTVEAGGTGGEPFYIATKKELDEFAARPDVEMDVVNFDFAKASEAIGDGVQ
jgi:hypothetical protein